MPPNQDFRDLFAAFNAEIFFPIVRPPGPALRTFGVKDPEGNIVQFSGR